MKVDKELDVRKMNCPMPVVLTRKALSTMADNEVLQVIATDPAALNDLNAFARSTGNELLSSEQIGDELRFCIRKRAAAHGTTAAPVAQCG